MPNRNQANRSCRWRRQHHFGQGLLGALHVVCCFLAGLGFALDRRLIHSAVGFQLLFHFMKLLFGVGYFQLRFGAIDFRENLLLAGIQFCALHVEPRFHYSGDVFFLRKTCLGPGLLDFCLRGL